MRFPINGEDTFSIEAGITHKTQTHTRIVTMSCVRQIWSFWSQFLVNFMENCPRQMPDFTANIHEIQYRLGLCPRPHWGSSQRSPDPIAGFGEGKGMGRAGKWEEGRKGSGKREGKGREGGEGGGKGGIFFCLLFLLMLRYGPAMQ